MLINKYNTTDMLGNKISLLTRRFPRVNFLKNFPEIYINSFSKKIVHYKKNSKTAYILVNYLENAVLHRAKGYTSFYNTMNYYKKVRNSNLYIKRTNDALSAYGVEIKC